MSNNDESFNTPCRKCRQFVCVCSNTMDVSAQVQSLVAAYMRSNPGLSRAEVESIARNFSISKEAVEGIVAKCLMESGVPNSAQIENQITRALTNMRIPSAEEFLALTSRVPTEMTINALSKAVARTVVEKAIRDYPTSRQVASLIKTGLKESSFVEESEVKRISKVQFHQCMESYPLKQFVNDCLASAGISSVEDIRAIAKSEAGTLISAANVPRQELIESWARAVAMQVVERAMGSAQSSGSNVSSFCFDFDTDNIFYPDPNGKVVLRDPMKVATWRDGDYGHVDYDAAGRCRTIPYVGPGVEDIQKIIADYVNSIGGLVGGSSGLTSGEASAIAAQVVNSLTKGIVLQCLSDQGITGGVTGITAAQAETIANNAVNTQAQAVVLQALASQGISADRFRSDAQITALANQSVNSLTKGIVLQCLRDQGITGGVTGITAAQAETIANNAVNTLTKNIVLQCLSDQGITGGVTGITAAQAGAIASDAVNSLTKNIVLQCLNDQGISPDTTRSDADIATLATQVVNALTKGIVLQCLSDQGISPDTTRTDAQINSLIASYLMANSDAFCVQAVALDFSTESRLLTMSVTDACGTKTGTATIPGVISTGNEGLTAAEVQAQIEQAATDGLFCNNTVGLAVVNGELVSTVNDSCGTKTAAVPLADLDIGSEASTECLLGVQHTLSADNALTTTITQEGCDPVSGTIALPITSTGDTVECCNTNFSVTDFDPETCVITGTLNQSNGAPVTIDIPLSDYFSSETVIESDGCSEAAVLKLGNKEIFRAAPFVMREAEAKRLCASNYTGNQTVGPLPIDLVVKIGEAEYPVAANTVFDLEATTGSGLVAYDGPIDICVADPCDNEAFLATKLIPVEPGHECC